MNAETALVTGVTGFAGRHLATLLGQEGWEVVGTCRSRHAELPGVRLVPVDVGDVERLREVLDDTRPRVVFHLAAIVDTVTTPDVVELMRVNALGTSAVLEAVRDCAAVDRVLVASSSFAYGRTEAADQPVSESTPLRPVTPYGASKAAAEDIALAWQRETGRDVVVTRAFQHTGPGHVGRYALSDWASQLVGRPASISVGNLDVVRDYLDVRDVARAYLEVAARANPGDVVNVGSGEERTMRLMLEGLVDAFGADTRIVVDPARLRAVDQPVFVADNEKLRGLGWRPRYTIGETLSDLAAWYDARDQARPSA